MGKKPPLKLFFSDFWFEFNPEDNFFTNLFRTRFEVTIDHRADLLVCSVFGDQWRAFPGKKIFFTGEYFPPEESFFDYSLSFYPRSETNYYLPLYRLYHVYDKLFEPRVITEAQWASKASVGTVFSNRSCAFRNWAFHQLDRDIGVGSGGRAFNNVGGPVPDKGIFLSGYKFSLACENTQWPGYATEKLVEAYVHRTVPLYWGDPAVGEVFNSGAFVSLSGKTGYPKALGRIRQALDDFHAYRSLFEAPLFPENREPDFLRKESIADFLEGVVASSQRTSGSPPHSGAVYRWRTWWRFREWGQSRLFWIRFLQGFSWVGYAGQGLKKLVKRWIGRKTGA